MFKHVLILHQFFGVKSLVIPLIGETRFFWPFKMPKTERLHRCSNS